MYKPMIIQAHLLLLTVSILNMPGLAFANIVKSASQGTQARIVELFSSDNCAGVRDLVRSEDAFTLRPNVMAIAAYCEVPGVNSNELFARAETIDPTGDLILTLHAKYVWKRDKAAAEPIWQKVLIYARNPYLIAMAQEYLAGMIAEDKPMSLKSTTYFGSILIGASADSNARPPELSYLPDSNSPGIILSARLNGQKWFPSGSISGNYYLNAAVHPSDTRYNVTTQEIDIPVALHAGKNEDLVFRPIGGLSTLNGAPYKSKIGIGVLGIIYRADYKQTLQGLIYSDHISLQQIEGEDADHFHFDYSWEFYPKSLVVVTQFSIEHSKAENTTFYAGIPGNFNNAHTDTSIDFSIQKEFGSISLGLSSRIGVRLDSAATRYTSPQTGEIVRVTRADTEVMLMPNLTLPIFPFVQLYAWYQWDKISSNIGEDSYVNRNYTEQVLGLALKTSLSSY
jgi:hypothetical protein